MEMSKAGCLSYEGFGRNDSSEEDEYNHQVLQLSMPRSKQKTMRIAETIVLDNLMPKRANMDFETYLERHPRQCLDDNVFKIITSLLRKYEKISFLKRKDSDVGEAARALEELIGSLFNELQTSDEPSVSNKD
nr:putative membrane protein [Tanacetum cinerariifolium]